jgi:hypothetical protein
MGQEIASMPNKTFGTSETFQHLDVLNALASGAFGHLADNCYAEAKDYGSDS